MIIGGPEGSAGFSIVRLGDYSQHPANPAINDAYYNTVDRTSYIWSGFRWETLVESGLDGINGLDGKSIIWLGAFATAPGLANNGVIDFNQDLLYSVGNGEMSLPNIYFPEKGAVSWTVMITDFAVNYPV